MSLTGIMREADAGRRVYVGPEAIAVALMAVDVATETMRPRPFDALRARKRAMRCTRIELVPSSAGGYDWRYTYESELPGGDDY